MRNKDNTYISANIKCACSKHKIKCNKRMNLLTDCYIDPN